MEGSNHPLPKIPILMCFSNCVSTGVNICILMARNQKMKPLMLNWFPLSFFENFVILLNIDRFFCLNASLNFAANKQRQIECSVFFYWAKMDTFEFTDRSEVQR